MKKILFAALLGLAATLFWHGQARAAESPWLTSLPAAQARAKAENKLVLLDFTGSDWCPGCIQLKKTVFDAPEFQAYAATNLVLVEVDFPQDKKISDELRKTNEELQARYHVNGFPTQIVLDQNGKELGRQEGYDGDGPKAYLAQLEKFKAGK
jgi:protein disulfide-isomerase